MIYIVISYGNPLYVRLCGRHRSNYESTIATWDVYSLAAKKTSKERIVANHPIKIKMCEQANHKGENQNHQPTYEKKLNHSAKIKK